MANVLEAEDRRDRRTDKAFGRSQQGQRLLLDGLLQDQAQQNLNRAADRADRGQDQNERTLDQRDRENERRHNLNQRMQKINDAREGRQSFLHAADRSATVIRGLELEAQRAPTKELRAVAQQKLHDAKREHKESMGEAAKLGSAANTAAKEVEAQPDRDFLLGAKTKEVLGSLRENPLPSPEDPGADAFQRRQSMPQVERRGVTPAPLADVGNEALFRDKPTPIDSLNISSLGNTGAAAAEARAAAGNEQLFRSGPKGPSVPIAFPGPALQLGPELFQRRQSMPQIQRRGVTPAPLARAGNEALFRDKPTPLSATQARSQDAQVSAALEVPTSSAISTGFNFLNPLPLHMSGAGAAVDAGLKILSERTEAHTPTQRQQYLAALRDTPEGQTLVEQLGEGFVLGQIADRQTRDGLAKAAKERSDLAFEADKFGLKDRRAASARAEQSHTNRMDAFVLDEFIKQDNQDLKWSRFWSDKDRAEKSLKLREKAASQKAQRRGLPTPKRSEFAKDMAKSIRSAGKDLRRDRVRGIKASQTPLAPGDVLAKEANRKSGEFSKSSQSSPIHRLVEAGRAFGVDEITIGDQLVYLVEQKGLSSVAAQARLIKRYSQEPPEKTQRQQSLEEVDRKFEEEGTPDADEIMSIYQAEVAAGGARAEDARSIRREAAAFVADKFEGQPLSEPALNQAIADHFIHVWTKSQLGLQ